MVVDLDELARRMLANYDARTPGELFGEPIEVTTVQAYALQKETARFGAILEKGSARRDRAPFGLCQFDGRWMAVPSGEGS